MRWLLVLLVILLLLYLQRRASAWCERRIELQRLWFEQVLYTRLYLQARFTNDRLADAYAARLLQTLPAGEPQVAALLREHVQGLFLIVDALVQKQDPSVAVAAWYANGRAIAAAVDLEFDSQLAAHLDKTLRQAQLMQAGGDSIAIFDAILGDESLVNRLAG